MSQSKMITKNLLVVNSIVNRQSKIVNKKGVFNER